MPATGTLGERSLGERALEALRRGGNPFRNYFARNPDDEVCARYHVPELLAAERAQLLGVVDLYRYDPGMHSEVVPVLGNKGSGKTHLLHSIKHGNERSWQLLVTPGIYQKGSDFLEYLLFQVIDTLLGGGRQQGGRPLEFVSEETARGLLRSALEALGPIERLELFPAPGLGRWTRRLGLGSTQAQERTQWLIDQLALADGRWTGDGPPAPASSKINPRRSKLTTLCTEAGLDLERACAVIFAYLERTRAHNSAGLMRRHIHQGMARAALLGDEAELAGFLTFGFAELDFQVRPTRQELVLTLFKVLMEVFLGLKIPVVAAFDQLEDLLLARRTDDGHRVAETFFAGIVQAMHQIDGICFLIFAERGLWNRFVPSLDGYIQDRLNNPIHVPGHGTLKALRLEAPSPELVQRVVEARLRPSLEELPDFVALPSIYPFNDEQVARIARTEPTLRDMLQQFRHLFDRLVYGADKEQESGVRSQESGVLGEPGRVSARSWSQESGIRNQELSGGRKPPEDRGQESALPFTVKSVVVVESLPETAPSPKTTSPASPIAKGGPSASPLAKGGPRGVPAAGQRLAGTSSRPAAASLHEIWELEVQAARLQLEPEGALTGATRELQAGLGAFLQTCHEHGVKVGPWRLQHVVGDWTFGDHPTFGALAIAHWACKDGQPWKVGIGLFLGRGPAKPKDLEIKLLTLEAEPALVDHLILLRPEDDLALSGKSKTLWQEAERRGRHARIEAMSLDGFAVLYAFPRWLAAAAEAQPDGQPLPNLADFFQMHGDKLLEQVCMPVSC